MPPHATQATSYIHSTPLQVLHATPRWASVLSYSYDGSWPLHQGSAQHLAQRQQL
jgi:hypothetical protein